MNEDISSEFRLMAARLGLGILDGHRIQEIADTWLQRGEYHDELVGVYDVRDIRTEDAVAALTKLLERKSVAIPDRETAVREIIRHYAQAVTSQQILPVEGLRKLMDEVYAHYDFHSSTQEFLGDSHGIEGLIGAHFTIDDIMGRSAGLPPVPEDQAILDRADQTITADMQRWLDLHIEP